MSEQLTLTLQKADGERRQVEVWPHAGGTFVTWCDVARKVDMYPSSWRRLGYEVVDG